MTPLHISGTAPAVAGATDKWVLLLSYGGCEHSIHGVAGLTHHAHHIADVHTHAKMVKEVRMDVKGPLNPFYPL